MDLSIKVESKTVKHLLFSRSSELQSALQKAGIDVEQFKVEVESWKSGSGSGEQSVEDEFNYTENSGAPDGNEEDSDEEDDPSVRLCPAGHLTDTR